MQREGAFGENIKYNSQTPIECLLGFVIDDGVSTRGHRSAVFGRPIYFYGGATNMHAKYGSMTVSDFTGSYNPEPYAEFPRIAVPTSAATYTNWSKWDDLPTCGQAPESSGFFEVASEEDID